MDRFFPESGHGGGQNGLSASNGRGPGGGLGSTSAGGLSAGGHIPMKEISRKNSETCFTQIGGDTTLHSNDDSQ